MDTRSLIKFGRNSYVVTLPQNWIKKEDLKKGDSLYLKENNDGLVVSSGSKIAKRQIQKIDMDITGKDIPRIKRELISHYINGCDLIKIRGKELINKSNAIREIAHSLVAFEVIEQTSSQVTARIFLPYRGIAIPQLVRKIDIIIRNMMQDLTADDVNYDDIFQRDEDVDRLTFLVLRIIKSNIQDNSSARAINLSNSQLLDYWNVAYNLEAIADETRMLSVALKDINVNKPAFREIIKLYRELVKTYTNTLDAYYVNAVEKAYRLSSIKYGIAVSCDKLYEKHWNKKGAVVALERIRDMNLLVHNVGRRVYS